MNTYVIKQDGFIIGQARGKNNAINHLKKVISWNGEMGEKWHTFSGMIGVNINDELVYTIEKQ